MKFKKLGEKNTQKKSERERKKEILEIIEIIRLQMTNKYRKIGYKLLL